MDGPFGWWPVDFRPWPAAAADRTIELGVPVNGGTVSDRLARRAWFAVGGGVAAVIVLIVAVVALTRGGGEEEQVATGHSDRSTTTEHATTVPSTPATAASAPTTTAPPPATAAFKYLPLFPFHGVDDARAWQQSYRSGGHQPWHNDAGMTAEAFVASLGFRDIDRVVSSQVTGNEAHLEMGYSNPNGEPAVAADIHLARLGSGDDAPWEVVGTRDTDLSLETPRYGATVRSPVTVGGHITGVDENLVVQVFQLSSEAPLGQSAGLPAGGVDSPWRTTVSFHGATDPVLTIVVSTGGHIQGVERFAITGVRR
jgi:hypothetical protein